MAASTGPMLAEARPQRRHPAERPLGGAALHDEVAGEPAPVARGRARAPLVGRASRRRSLAGTAPSRQPRRGSGEERPSSVVTTLAALARRARPRSTSAIARGYARASRGTSRPLSPVVAPYIAPSIATFASSRVATTPLVDDARVEVAPAAGRGHRLVARHARRARAARAARRRRPRASSRGRRPPRRGRASAAAARRRPRSPSARWRAARHVVGPEPPVDAPRSSSQVQPLRAEQAGELLVLEQRLDRRMVVLARAPSARVESTWMPARSQGAQQVGLRVEVERLARRAPSRTLHGERLHAGRLAPRRRARARAPRSSTALVHRAAPRQPGRAASRRR